MQNSRLTTPSTLLRSRSSRRSLSTPITAPCGRSTRASTTTSSSTASPRMPLLRPGTTPNQSTRSSSTGLNYLLSWQTPSSSFHKVLQVPEKALASFLHSGTMHKHIIAPSNIESRRSGTILTHPSSPIPSSRGYMNRNQTRS